MTHPAQTSERDDHLLQLVQQMSEAEFEEFLQFLSRLRSWVPAQ